MVGRQEPNLWLRGIILTLVLVVGSVLAIGVGSVPIPGDTIVNEIMTAISGQDGNTQLQRIIFDIRVPRIVFAALAGAILAISGLLMQTISQNYLADPYVLGVSSGASMGAVFYITSSLIATFGFYHTYGVYISAFMGAMLATILVVYIAGSSSNPVKLVLMGMGISSFFSGLTMLFIYGAKDEAQVRSAMFWLLGSFAGVQWRVIPIAVIVCTLLIAFVWFYRHELDVVLLGRKEAEHVGLSVHKLQLAVVLITSVSIAIVVSIVGVIGFVGLLIPHVARGIAEARHGVMVWFTTLVGAIMMVGADAIARFLYAPEELPIGILTACVGAPVFMWIISKKYGDA